MSSRRRQWPQRIASGSADRRPMATAGNTADRATRAGTQETTADALIVPA